MRFVGALLFLFGGGGTGFATWATFNRKRPQDILFAVLAPVALMVALIGILLVFVPDFF